MADVKISIVDARQSKRPSVLRQITIVIGVTAALFGPGLLAESAAMQWAGFILFLILACLAVLAHDRHRLTIAEARQKLDEMEKADG